MSDSDQFNWLEFHRTLTQAGITSERADFQRKIGELVEAVAGEIVGISGDSYYDWMMTGSYVEGWGNHLFRLDGVTGRDSDIDWSQVVKHKVYHLSESCKSVVDCINRKDYVLVNGHIDVKNCSLQPAFNTGRHGLRPEADECHAYPCCSYPKTVLDETANGAPRTIDGHEVHPSFLKMLEKQFDNEKPEQDVHFVRASVPGKTNQMRLSCTRQERYIMGKLTTVQGQLFTVLKYLFKDVLKLKIDSREEPVLKSFHAKTLLMTQLRHRASWPTESTNCERNVDEENGKMLEHLVLGTLTKLKVSVDEKIKKTQLTQSSQGATSSTGSLSLESQQQQRQQQLADEEEATLKVLEHALLHDCGLYLKVKKKNNGEKSDYRPKLLDALSKLLDGNPPMLNIRLLKYQKYIGDTLAVRRSAGDEPKFLFVPLLMLPRINLDTLLEELLRGENPTAALESREMDGAERSDFIESIKCRKLVTGGSAQHLLRDAYITVWLILKSLTSSPSSGQPDYSSVVDIAWKWVSKQPCLQTAYKCLQAMKLMKNGNTDELKILLKQPHQPKRWIELHKGLHDLVNEEDCIWAFHYFVRPKDVMEFAYLKEVQDGWIRNKLPVDGFDEKCKNEKWLLPLMFKKGDEGKTKKSSQPSLTVNFDSLLCSFRSWVSVSEQTDEDEFFKFMKNCLFEPRPVKASD